MKTDKMKVNQLLATGKKKIKKLWELWQLHRVRDPQKVGSIVLIWKGEYPPVERRMRLRIGGERNRGLTWLERFLMVALLIRTYLDWAYLWRKIKLLTEGKTQFEEGESQFIEKYVFGRSIFLLIMLYLPMPFWLETVIGALIGWEITGLLCLPLRIVLVDRYAYADYPYRDWAPYSFNRSFIFLIWNYLEMVIAFAYMYRHFDIVRYSDCGTPISTFGEALYFSVVTITTLGYGDIRPVPGLGRFLTSVQPMMGIILLVLVVGLFFVEVGRQRNQR